MTDGITPADLDRERRIMRAIEYKRALRVRDKAAMREVVRRHQEETESAKGES